MGRDEDQDELERMNDDPSRFRRYLLGDLDEEEGESFEKTLMLGDETFEELLVAEDELVDDYVEGSLSARERQLYHERFLATAERRRQHRFGAALREHVAAAARRESVARLEPAPARSPVERGERRSHLLWRWSLAAAVAALAVAGLWSVVREGRAPFRLEEPSGGVEGSRVAFFLPENRLRGLPGDATQTLTVPPGTGLVDLQLGLPRAADGEYEVTLEDPRREAVLAEGRLPARSIEGQRVVVATVPSELLKPGDYRVVVNARPASRETFVEVYEFRVTRPQAR